MARLCKCLCTNEGSTLQNFARSAADSNLFPLPTCSFKESIILSYVSMYTPCHMALLKAIALQTFLLDLIIALRQYCFTMNIQSDIKEMLADSGWSTSQLAREAEINPSALFRFLSKNKPGKSIADRLWPYVYGDKRPPAKA